MKLPFTKVEAIGNNFIFIDALEMPEIDWSTLAIDMCAHHFGVGSDGLLVLLPSSKADYRLRMFNPDGTEDTCGNGLRCAAVYLHEREIDTRPETVFESMSGLHHTQVYREAGKLMVTVNMGRPSLRPADIPALLDVEEVRDYPLEVNGDIVTITAVMVGTPHAVIIAPLESFWDSIPAVSALIETHPVFPERVSVTWCAQEPESSLRIRTWERGVGPTLGCGTGACSALVAAHLRGLVGTEVQITSPGGTLKIEWPDRGDIFLTGGANLVFDGEWPL